MAGDGKCVLVEKTNDRQIHPGWGLMVNFDEIFATDLARLHLYAVDESQSKALDLQRLGYLDVDLPEPQCFRA